jgi:hypothetical protein
MTSTDCVQHAQRTRLHRRDHSPRPTASAWLDTFATTVSASRVPSAPTRLKSQIRPRAQVARALSPRSTLQTQLSTRVCVRRVTRSRAMQTCVLPVLRARISPSTDGRTAVCVQSMRRRPKVRFRLTRVCVKQGINLKNVNQQVEHVFGV